VSPAFLGHLSIIANKKQLPHQTGAAEYPARYGDSLVAVRYHYDADGKKTPDQRRARRRIKAMVKGLKENVMKPGLDWRPVPQAENGTENKKGRGMK
jgi:hypothetical protein